MSKYKSFFYISSSLLFIIFLISKYLTINTMYIGGHDTFQYIHWSDILLTEERNLIFFRPVLYLIVFIFHNFFDWSPLAFKYMLIFFSSGSFIILCAILKKLRTSIYKNLLILLSYIFSISLLVADAVGHITAIENFFVFLILFISLNLIRKKSFLNYFLFFLTAISMTFVHEEKFLYAVLLIFVIEKNLIASLKLVFLLCLITIIGYLIIGGQTVDNNSAKIASSIALSWGNHLYFINNIIDTFQSAMNQFGFIQSVLCLFIFLYVIKIWITDAIFLYKSNPTNNFYNNLIKLYELLFHNNLLTRDVSVLLIPSIFYFILIGIIFAGLDLPRTTSPIMFPILIGAIVLILNYKAFETSKILVTLFFILSALLNLYKSIIDIDKHDFEEEKYANAFSLLKQSGYKCSVSRKIGIDQSFEDRPPMWGGSDNKYGLSSKVYMGSCAEKILLENSNDLREYGAIVFYKDNLSEVQTYTEFEGNPDWKKLSNKNVIIFLRR